MNVSESSATRATWHRTKIVCTLGPATDAPGVLERMIGAGMDVARINMSHGSAAEHARRVRDVRETALRMGQAVAVLADLPGPKFRLGDIAGGARKLDEGSEVALGTDAGDTAILPIRNPELLHALRAGEVVFLADGAVELRVKRREGERVICEVPIGGIVRSGSGINVPDSDLGALVPTPDDRRHLSFALDQGVEWIGVSFVQSAADLARVRSCFDAGRRALLMAKIEKRRALVDLDAIVKASDAVMVARGDLGVETDLAHIPLVQKRIIAAANREARPVVTATQMLESMIEHEHPTRAEVTDVANAVLDGTDAVMLSGETAIGKHPAAAVDILDRVLRATETEHPTPTMQVSKADAISSAASRFAQQIGAKAIVAAIDNIGSAAAIAGVRPEAPLILVSDSAALTRTLALVRGVAPLESTIGLGPPACIALAKQWLYARDLARPGEQVVLLFAQGANSTGPDTIQAVCLE
ncbi:MAG: pyruvate kinase [Burkholderiales bacterium]